MCRTIVKLLESKASTGRLQKGYLNILQPWEISRLSGSMKKPGTGNC
jgi:hypothetical protein